MKSLAPVGLAAVIVITLAGCTAQKIGQAQSELADARVELAALVDALEPLATDTDTQGVVESVIRAIAVADEGIAAGQAVVDAVATADDPGQAVREGGAAVAATLPMPLQSYVLLGTTLAGAVISLLYRRRGKLADATVVEVTTAAHAIGRAIEKAKSSDGTVNFADAQVKRNLRADMGAVAIRLVDEGRGLAEG